MSKGSVHLVFLYFCVFMAWHCCFRLWQTCQDFLQTDSKDFGSQLFVWYMRQDHFRMFLMMSNWEPKRRNAFCTLHGQYVCPAHQKQSMNINCLHLSKMDSVDQYVSEALHLPRIKLVKALLSCSLYRLHNGIWLLLGILIAEVQYTNVISNNKKGRATKILYWPKGMHYHIEVPIHQYITYMNSHSKWNTSMGIKDAYVEHWHRQMPSSRRQMGTILVKICIDRRSE